MEKLKTQHEEILKHTIEIYIENSQPVSSNLILDRGYVDFSSAKVRYLMNDLEQLGYLEKAHVSSGRIPTIKGLDYYAKYLSLTDEDKMIKRLKQLFNKRNINIDKTVEDAAQIISESTGLTLVTGSDNSRALLKTIQFVPISNNSATIVLVISTGEVFSKFITLDTTKHLMDDLRIAVRLFNERLIDSPIYELPQRTYALKDILAQAVKNYEELIQSFVTDIFMIKTDFKNNIYGKQNIILSDSISRVDLNEMLNVIENHSIWEFIEKESESDEKLKISVSRQGTYISKRIDCESPIREVSVVGSTVSDFTQMRAVIHILEELLRKRNGDK